MLQNLKALWAFRMFILGSVKREFQLKYRNSLFGAAWTIINPLALILVYTVIFSQVMQAKLPGVDNDLAYSVYLCAGVLTWGLFAEIVGRAQNVFIENANILKKVCFPKVCLSVIVILNSLVNFLIIFSLFLAFLVLSGFWPGWPVLAVIPVLIIELIFAIGLGVSVGVLNVFFRDVGQFFGIFLQFWFWFTPLVYPINILPDDIKPLIFLNPMYSIVDAYQGIFVSQKWPDWTGLSYPLILGVLVCMLGLRLFRMHSAEMVDEL